MGTFQKLLFAEQAVAVLINHFKGFDEVLGFVLGCYIVHQKDVRRFLKTVFGLNLGSYREPLDIYQTLDEMLVLLLLIAGGLIQVFAEPRVIQNIQGAEPLFGIHLHHFLDEVLGLPGDEVPVRTVHFEHADLDVLHDHLVVVSGEGRVSAEQDVKNHSQGPDVALFVVGLPSQDLRSDVVGRAALALDFLAHLHLGGAEVYYFDDELVLVHCIVGEEYVFGLEVPVDYVEVVAVQDCGDDLLHDQARRALADVAQPDDVLEQLAAFAIVSHDVEVLRVLVELVHFYNVGVVLLF